MIDNRVFKKQCPYCRNWISVSELIPDNTTISFFADFRLNNGQFEKGRCFASITGLKRKSKEKKIEFVKNDNVKELF